jgi:hypothetical protein
MPARSWWRRSASHPLPTVAEPGRFDAQPGWPQVVLVVIAVVAVVLGAAALTGFLPAGVQRAIYDTPVAIAFLIVGTGWWLWRISRRGPGAPDR